jgi:flagellin
MANNIVLTGGVRQNLLSLQSIADMMTTTQNRLATGKKVNSPIDNAVNYFTSQGLQNRANDLNALLDAMSNAVQTVAAANTGIQSIVTTIQSMQSTLIQARQDSSWQSTSYTYSVTATGKTIGFSGGSIGTATITVSLDTAGAVDTIDEAVAAINANVSLQNKIKATNDAGTLRITNLSTAALKVTGGSGATIDGTTNTNSVAANTVRVNLVNQFNELLDQLDKFSSDSSYNGTNLLQGDVLKVIFNEQSTSELDIMAKDNTGNPVVINASNLGITALVNSDLNDNTNIDTLLNGLTQSLDSARSEAANFGSSLSVVQNRQDFTKQMISTLKAGSDNLVVADTNEEGANMLALQTRQQLSIAALSLANQANQSVLRLFS